VNVKLANELHMSFPSSKTFQGFCFLQWTGSVALPKKKENGLSRKTIHLHSNFPQSE
jgi:hypothetical protein